MIAVVVNLAKVDVFLTGVEDKATHNDIEAMNCSPLLVSFDRRVCSLVGFDVIRLITSTSVAAAKKG